LRSQGLATVELRSFCRLLVVWTRGVEEHVAAMVEVEL
jgi:hypothetical protein